MLSKLFGKLFAKRGDDDRDDAVEPERYKDCVIRPAPMNRGGQFLTAGVIEREIDGELRSRRFIRADAHADYESAVAHARAKGRQIVDERSADLFDDDGPI